MAGLGLAVVAVGMALFGLPPVDLRSPLDHLGITCPLCGGTRAARLTSQGHFVEAWRYNPLGIGVVVVSVMVVVRAAWGLLSRRWLTVIVRLTPRAQRILVLTVLALTVLLTIRQQLRADLLLGT